MKKVRSLHLWIGIICSVFIFIEALTGFLMSEPQLIGGTSDKRQINRQFNQGGLRSFTGGNQTNEQSGDQTQQNPATGNGGQRFRNFPGARAEAGGVMGWIRALHQGNVGGTNLRIVVDLTAVGMMVLTVTGVTMSVQVLRVQRRSRKRAQAEEQA